MCSQPNQKIQVVLLAGQRPGVDPVAALFGETYKATANINGRAMLNRVMDAIDASGRVVETFILMQEPEVLRARPEFSDLTNRPDVHILTSNSSISGSLLEFLDKQQPSYPLLVTTCDHILLRGQDINDFIDSQPNDTDLSVGLIRAETVLSAHPTIQRTWLRFKDGAYTSCNLFMLMTPGAKSALKFWATVEQDRKKVMKLAWRFGISTLLLYLFNKLSLKRTFSRASKSFGATISPVLLKHADLAIDVDKPSDVEFVQQFLGK